MKQKTKPSVQLRLLISIALLVIAAILVYASAETGQTYRNDVTVDNLTEAVTEQAQFPLNLNTATEEELAQIDGLGEGLAYQIVAYREEIGAYTNPAQLKNIRGISDALFERIKQYVTV